MSITVKVKQIVEKQVQYLQAECGVRYWEDGVVNGVEDEDGTLIPCRVGDTWKPTINVETGKIEGWPEGTTASIHYKVCDDGIYRLLDADKNVVFVKDGYVPETLRPIGNGDDYVIMDISADGTIDKWSFMPEDFVGDDDE